MACRVGRSLGASTCVHSVFCYDRLYGHLTYHIDFVIEPKTPNSHHHTDAITVLDVCVVDARDAMKHSHIHTYAVRMTTNSVSMYVMTTLGCVAIS